MGSEFRISPVGETEAELDEVRELFVEYADSLDLRRYFEGFERELAELPGQYAPPTGRILVAREVREDRSGDASSTFPPAAGVVAVRSFSAHIAEMKRLFVRPAYRGRRLGRLLATSIVDTARDLGYEKMRLDTLETLEAAMGLYRGLGFMEIPRYYGEPEAGVHYFELALR